MKNPALHHFPHFRFRHGERVLWNPILRKEYKNLPEERVRLQFVEYLLEEVGFSKHRISFESPVNLPRDKSSSRTDLICYDDDFKPLLLVECKANEVKLDAKVALQIARYNKEIGAPFLLVTNGIQAFWFSSENEELKLQNNTPIPFSSKTQPTHVFDYWNHRGFLGVKSHPLIRSWLVDTCAEFYLNPTNPPGYLTFTGSNTELLLANYYWIRNIADSTKLALALSSTPHGATKLIAILNIDGENRALMNTSLDLLANHELANTTIQSNAGTKTVDLVSEIGFSFERSIMNYVSELVRVTS